MNIKYSLLLVSFFLSITNVHAMKAAAEASNKQENKKQNPGEQLHEGIMASNLELVLAALSNNANPNIALGIDHNHLQQSIACDNSPEIIEALLLHGAHPDGRNTRDEYRRSALHNASTADVVRLLVQYKADTDAVDIFGRNAVCCPTQYKKTPNNYALTKALIDHNVDPNLRDKRGISPLLRAAFDQLNEVVRALLDGGADINATDPDGNNALQYAVSTFKTKDAETIATIQVLVNGGLDPYSKNNNGESALEIAQMFDSKIGGAMVPAILEALDKRQKAE